MDIGGGGRTVPLAKLVPVVLLVGPETGRDGYGLGRGHSGVAYRPAKTTSVGEFENLQETFPVFAKGKGMKTLLTHPVESDGGSDGQASDTGVVPSEETSSWVNG